jgi:neutral ceramidase
MSRSLDLAFCAAFATAFTAIAAARGAESAGPELPFKVGFAERDITPELGMEQPGGYGKSYHRSFHDPCKVRAVVFDDGRTRVALVGVDGGFIYRPVVEACRAAIRQRCGIPPEAVLVGASHSHSSGPLGIVQPGQYDHASAFVQSLAYEKSSCADPRYLAAVEREIVEAVCQADAGRVEARAGVGVGCEDQVAFNRRLRMKNGRTYTHPGQGNPDIVGYAGPTDPAVGVIGAWDTEGKLLGCVVNFACHATTSPGGISANYIYYLEQTIRGAMGAECVVVFLQGFAGDVTQVDNLSPYAHPSPERWARLVGGRIGAEAVKVLLSMEPGSLAPLEARSKVLHIKRRVPSPERVRRSYEIVKKDPKEAGATDWAFAKEIVLLDALVAKSPVEEVEVQAVQLGPAVLLANPAEMFCQYGLDLKAASPFPITFPIGYSNGFVAYVPTEEAFGEHGGGYETRLTSCTNLEVTAGRQIVEASLELARMLTPGAVPAPPPAPPFRGPRPAVPPELE